MRETLRGITARQLIRALEKDGFVCKRTTGSHRIYRHPDGRRVVIAYHHPGDTFPQGTLRAMIGDADWTDADVERPGLGR